ncbi:vacuolar protein sorting-associated protein 8 homolog isoform X1 [Maniola jurtina]|uniref:vacuolar protein sorting-associated protein 8 homolog isoform X1 n=1 Tax=Maniola jurtina TaxID=191418 RepID=UPI001E68D549|nr:vacuolar protein sorting-associated protein 8 homolog isoform X1 [Maniola jurtina]
MDLLKTPSTQSLLDSDLESVESLQYVDIEELDEVEYALPTSEAPTLAEVLSSEELESENKISAKKFEDTTCSALQVDFLQAISQQLIQAQERSSAGAATTVSVGSSGRLTVGTAHGHLLSFLDQTLRWVCDAHGDNGAVTCLSYNHDGTRLLAGFARGLVYQYESIRGLILRRVTLGGELWGTLRVTWAGTSGLALDTGGSVWLIRFSRPLGVRSARVSCLFSGARGEVVAMTARDARILALATLSRVIIVAGGRAAGVRLDGPPDVLPVLEWCELDNRILVAARANIMQWLAVTLIGSSISLRPVQRVELKSTPIWLGWLGGSLAIFDSDENLRLWGDDYDKPLDLSQIEPVYSSAFFKGHWTDGRVSRAMCKAGESALGGACTSEGTLTLLGRRGVVRVKPRDLLARAQAFIDTGRYSQALRLLCSSQGAEAKKIANEFIGNLADRPHILSNKNVAIQVVKLCLKYDLSEELWNCLWENCSGEQAFVEALGDAAVRGELANNPPSPDFTQELIERLAEFEPDLVERVVASLPLTSLDPHRASVFTRDRGLWRGVGAIAAALDGCSGAMRELVQFVDAGCAGAAAGAGCGCAGGALLLAAADALAGRGAGGRALPAHARPSARHDALHTLLAEEAGIRSPLRVLVLHDTSAAIRLLEQCSREPPFAGPLGKQNRLRVARALLAYTTDLQESDRRLEIIEFIAGQLSSGALPLDHDLIKNMQEFVVTTDDERSDRAWLMILTRIRSQRDQMLAQYRDAILRPRVLWRLDAMLDRHDEALKEFFEVQKPSSKDIDEFFEYLRSRIEVDGEMRKQLKPHLPALVELRPRSAAALLNEESSDLICTILDSLSFKCKLEFGECLLDAGRLRGDAAAIYLRTLCTHRPGDVKDFLIKNAGIVRPEDALAIVRELGPDEAESICLEATGDHLGALDALLRSISSSVDEESKANIVSEASALCARVGPTVPTSVAAELWTRLLRGAGAVPPPLLFEAIAYLPLEQLVVKTCESPRVACAVLAGGAARRAVWQCAARILQREAHEALARALAAARRGAAARGSCRRCGAALACRAGARTSHCARAFHADCEPEAQCACGRRAPAIALSLPPWPRRRAAPPPDCDLLLRAPPRPDLEGVV